jgi:hypothetical protein
VSNRELSALRNMPIWIDRCNRRAHSISRVEGHTHDFAQLLVLRDYMQHVVMAKWLT